MGPIGTGAVGKLIKNMLGGAETLIVHEAIQIGIAGGIPYPKALEMMRRIGHDSVLNRWQRTFDPSGSDPMPRSGRNVLNKDIPLVAELARLLGTDTPITQQLAAAAERVVAANEKRNSKVSSITPPLEAETITGISNGASIPGSRFNPRRRSE